MQCLHNALVMPFVSGPVIVPVIVVAQGCLRHADQTASLMCRGSLEAGDVFSDISANPLDMHFLNTDGRVHEGVPALVLLQQRWQQQNADLWNAGPPAVRSCEIDCN